MAASRVTYQTIGLHAPRGFQLVGQRLLQGLHGGRRVNDGGPEHARVAEPDGAKTSGSVVGPKSAGGRSYRSPRLVALELAAASSHPRLDPVRHHLQTALERYFAMLIILTWVNASSPS
jgi:hypothetical protein